MTTEEEQRTHSSTHDVVNLLVDVSLQRQALEAYVDQLQQYCEAHGGGAPNPLYEVRGKRLIQVRVQCPTTLDTYERWQRVRGEVVDLLLRLQRLDPDEIGAEGLHLSELETIYEAEARRVVA